MTQGGKKKNSTIIHEQQGGEDTCGNPEVLQVTEGRENTKFLICSAGSDVDPADADHDSVQGDCQRNDELPTLFCLNVQRHEGETCEGQFHGEGVAFFEGGHMYKGMFSRGLMDGLGVLTLSNGLKYEGEFECNTPMGQGTYTWPDGSSYKGGVYKGIRHGSGTYKCAKTLVSYKGQWDLGKRHGKGTVYYDKNKTSWYKGDWVKNNREGWGVRCYPSGNIYSGEWKNNQKHGQGTMRWLKLGQQYDGEWVDGVQHGQGTHVWIVRRVNGSKFYQDNQYTGDFVQGQRHGQGTFYYAGGAVYEGEWKNNQKHGQGKFTFKDGHVLYGEFVDDQMMKPSLYRNRAPTHLCASSLSERGDSSTLGPEVALNIQCLLDKIPERKWNDEYKQVGGVLLRLDKKLKSIYSFYSSVGHTTSPCNQSLLSRLQLWRLLKDCKIHHHGITLTQIDHLIKEDTTTEIHSPFTPILFRRLISCLVIVAYHIYNKEVKSRNNFLAGCLSKLMTDDILPNAKNVKGFLFGQPHLSVVSMTHMKRCWEIYQAYCRVSANPKDDQIMTSRHLLWMFKDLCLLDNNLTTAKLLEIITAESHDSNNLSSCLDLEITFLEFFEVLLSCAEVKCKQISEDLEEDRSLSSPCPVVKTTNSSSQMRGKSSDMAEFSPAHEVGSPHVKHRVTEKPESGDYPKDDTGEVKGIRTRTTEIRHCELELWAQTIYQFFNHIFFPAFEHHQLVTTYMNKRRNAPNKTQEKDR
ncbi:hypothetical protein Q5P01_023758 [Channa striata]|uniref:Uncharacterized protein n=1 Tax=Channa striata TaxID=64152 RepID=A0AA88IU57_CHASR|nr:hypothetical protein Q5P01_023758 [Channa striata]